MNALYHSRANDVSCEAKIASLNPLSHELRHEDVLPFVNSRETWPPSGEARHRMDCVAVAGPTLTHAAGT